MNVAMAGEGGGGGAIMHCTTPPPRPPTVLRIHALGCLYLAALTAKLELARECTVHIYIYQSKQQGIVELGARAL